MHIIALILALLSLTAYGFVKALKWFTRPASRAEIARNLKISAQERHRAASERAEGKSPRVWVPKLFGPLGVRQFRAADYFQHMRRLALANVGEGFHPRGLKTYYPSDVVPNNTVTNPYTNRYMLVKQAPQGTTLSATLAPGWTVLADDICTVMAAADISIPLGILTDDVGNATLDVAPYSGNVQLLGNAAGATLQGVTDAAIPAGKLLVGSQTVAGQLGNVPNVAGIYWCVGMSLSTSEGAATLIEFDGHRFPIGVDVIT